MINNETMKARLTFTEKVLGTSPANEQVYRDYIGSKAEDADSIEEEIEALGIDGVFEKGMTIFSKTDELDPFLWDYQLRGFFKGSAGFLKSVKGTESSKVKNYKKKIDGLVFVSPRKIVFKDYGNLDILQRPLRAMTMRGERVALAASECVDAGATVEFTVELFPDEKKEVTMDTVREWLDYGVYSGIGQWHNSGMGRFVWEELDESGNVIGGNKK